MPPVRKKLLNAKLDSSRVRPRALEKSPGLAQSPKCAEMGQASSKGKEKALPTVIEPDTDMIGSAEIIEEIALPAFISYGVRGPSNSSPIRLKSLEKDALKAAPKTTLQPKAASKAKCTLELRPNVEDEERQTKISPPRCLIGISEFNAKIESSSKIVIFRINNVPLKVNTLESLETVEVNCLSNEIARMTLEEL